MTSSNLRRWLASALALGLLAAAGCAGSSDSPAASEPTAESDASVAPPTSVAADAPTTEGTTTPYAPEGPSETAAPPRRPAGRLDGKVVTIDPGHNGGNGSHAAEISRQVDIGTKKKECDTTGASTNDGYPESRFTLDVSRRLRDVLEEAGATVVMTRTDDSGWGPCIDERAAIGNRAGADAAISVHADGGPSGGHGFHVLYPASISGLTDDIAGPSKRLAVSVRDAYASGTGLPYATYLGDEGLMARDDLGGLNLSDVPKIFIECGNMRSATDAALLEDPEFRQRMAEALAAGLTAFLLGS